MARNQERGWRSGPLDWNFRPLGGGDVRITLTFDQGTLGATYSQGEIRSLVEAMCSTADLPDPWKKG